MAARVVGQMSMAGLCTVLCLRGTADAAVPEPVPVRHEQLYDFDIPSQDLHNSLQAVALAANLRLLYRSDIVNGVVSRPLRARCTAAQALDALLEGTDLRYEVLRSSLVLIRRPEQTVAERLREEWARLRAERAADTRRTEASAAQALEEIFVTAQKRVESVQDIPVSINVVTGETLAAEGVRDVRDVGKAATALEINTRQGQATIVGLRGLQQTGFSPTGDTLAAVHLDGVFLNNFWGLNGMMFDLERVEVLAGPQGTLYGRNAAAGAINLITTRPGHRLAGNAALEIGSFGTRRVDGGISVPFSDTLAVRLAGTKYERDALYSDGGAVIDQWGGRLSVQWMPTPLDTIFMTVDHIDTGGTNESGGLYAVDRTARAYDAVTNTFSDAQPESVMRFAGLTGDPYDNAAYVEARGQVFSGHIRSEHSGAMAQYTHDFAGFDGVLLYSHRRLEAISQSALRSASAPFATLFPQVAESDVAEFRLVSDTSAPLSWVGGLFWLQGTALHSNAVPNPLHPTAAFSGEVLTALGPLSVLGTPPPDPNTGFDVPGCPCLSGFSPVNGETTAYAVYGQATWSPAWLPQWRFTGGLRYSHDEKRSTQGYFVNGVLQSLWVPELGAIPDYLARSIITTEQAAGTDIPATVVRTDGSGTWNQLQYRFGVEYETGGLSRIYGTVSTGYKSGGFAYGSTPRLKPETLLAWEIGTKSRFLDQSLQVNTAFWWYDYEDLEVAVPRPIPPPFPLVNNVPQTTVPSVASAGNVHLGGFSVDLDWALTARDRLALSTTFIHSRIVDGTETRDGVITEVIREGQRLGDAPKWQWLGRYTHVFDLPGGATLAPALKYQWQSGKYDGGAIPAGSVAPGVTSIDPRTGTFNLSRSTPGQTRIPSQWILDLQVKFTPPGRTWDLTAYVHNVTDELDIKQLNYSANPLAGAVNGNYGHTTVLLGEPRMVGLIFGTRF